MLISQANEINRILSDGRWVEGANKVLSLLGRPSTVTQKSEAIQICRGLFQFFLDSDNYLAAAALAWGPDVFQCEPESTVRIFKALEQGSMILLCGSSSMSKTYAAGAFFYLDYRRDPLYTTVKLAAVNEDHLKKNLFAHVSTLHRACVIPCEYDIQIRDSDLWMGIKEAGYEFGISGIAFKQSQDTSGQFKGYKAKPVRRKPHPRFGVMSRLRVLGDEGQNWPGGPFKDFNSLIASKSGSDLIKIAVAFNPESTSQHVVQIAEPEQGWDADDLDRLYDWESKAGWRVCRLDAALCENVKQKRIVFPGLQTYEGFMSYLKSGGDSSANYWCFARGFPPLKGSVFTIIPPEWPQAARGEATFIETPITVAAVDLAFMGQDSAQMSVGRWGLASGFRDYMGKHHIFLDRLNEKNAKPRHLLQIDQILPLQKSDNTVVMSQEIIGRCKMLSISPEHLAVDATGYGFGVAGHLAKVFGEIYAIAWNHKATERKILSEDQEGADAQVDGIMSEMWWAFRRWLDPNCKAILINPIIPTSPIHTQLTSRRYRNGKNGIKVESKEEYKSRNQSSPDEADSCFVAGTQVLTPYGGVEIEKLSVGDIVSTPFGETRIACVHVTETNRLTRITSSNGRVLEGKPAHKIFTWNNGWVRMDALVLTDTLESYNDLPSWTFLNSLFTPVKHTAFKLLVPTIKTETRLRQRDFYIELSGLSTLALYRKVCMSTIKTMIGQTIAQIILRFSRHPPIQNTTTPYLDKTLSIAEKLKPEGLMQLNLPPPGTPHQRVLPGTQRTEEKPGETERNQKPFVLFAKNHTYPIPLVEKAAAQPVAETRGLFKKCPKFSATVLFAAILSVVRKFISRKHAPESVQVFSVPQPVKTYNLTLERHNVYYANGLLVDNCIMLVMLVRKFSDILPGLVEQQGGDKREPKDNKIRFTSVKDYENTDLPDSISEDPHKDADSPLA